MSKGSRVREVLEKSVEEVIYINTLYDYIVSKSESEMLDSNIKLVVDKILSDLAEIVMAQQIPYDERWNCACLHIFKLFTDKETQND